MPEHIPMGACPTVRIKSSHPSQGDFVSINAADFDSTKHALYVGPVVVAALPPPPPIVATPAPVDPLANLPKDWRDGSVAKLRGLCEQVTGRTPDDKRQAVEMIEAALRAHK